MSGSGSSTPWNNNRQLATISQVGILFKVFARRFSHKWEKTNNDAKARSVWLEDLRCNGVTDEMINTGIMKSSALDWPPSVGEFIKLCKPSDEDLGIPGADEAYKAAATGNWRLHPIVWHAAQKVGTYELRNHAEANVRPRFLVEYSRLVQEARSGEVFHMPDEQDVPRIERQYMSRQEVKEKTASLLRSLRGEDKA